MRSSMRCSRRARRGSASPPTCTCTRRARRVLMPPCPRGCRTEGWKRGSGASRTGGSRAAVARFLRSGEHVRREVALPWVSFDSDADAPAPEGVFLKSSRHPRTYGNFARVLAKYVREERVLTLQEAIRKLAALPAAT